MKKLLILLILLTLASCKTVNVYVYADKGAGDVTLEVQVKGSDLEADAKLK